MQKNPKTKLKSTKTQNKNITQTKKKPQTLNKHARTIKTVQYKMNTKQQKSKQKKIFKLNFLKKKKVGKKNIKLQQNKE